MMWRVFSMLSYTISAAKGGEKGFLEQACWCQSGSSLCDVDRELIQLGSQVSFWAQIQRFIVQPLKKQKKKKKRKKKKSHILSP